MTALRAKTSASKASFEWADPFLLDEQLKMYRVAPPLLPGEATKNDLDTLIQTVVSSISGSRARDYTMRLWQNDKWNTLPAWKRTARPKKPD